MSITYEQIEKMSTADYRRAILDPKMKEEIESVIEDHETKKLAFASFKEFQQTYPRLTKPELTAIVELTASRNVRPTFQEFVNSYIQIKETRAAMKDFDDPKRAKKQMPTKFQIESWTGAEMRQQMADPEVAEHVEKLLSRRSA